jgi:hypothetical protein
MQRRRVLVTWHQDSDDASVCVETHVDGHLETSWVADRPFSDYLVAAALALWQEQSGQLFDR